jgi:myosin tail region-interacting protein MTI1
MSDPPPVKPKPGSLRDRIAAFEQKPNPSLPAASAPRPKPGNLSQWKPRSSSPPPDSQPTTTRNDNNSMSASDAKESITKGGSLKERMAMLQGLGAFGGGQSATPPPKPAEKPKWKPPPQVTLAPPITGDDADDNDVSTSGADDNPPTSPLKAPSDDIVAALTKPPPPAEEETSQIEGEVPTTGDEQVDPEEEERQRRAAIAARMARLGGTRVGMGPPIFGRKPEIKPKPSMPSPEVTKEEPPAPHAPPVEPALGSERDVEHAQAEADVAMNGTHICA